MNILHHRNVNIVKLKLFAQMNNIIELNEMVEKLILNTSRDKQLVSSAYDKYVKANLR